MENLNYLILGLIKDRQASWPFAAIIWSLTSFLLRDMFLSSLFSRLRDLDKGVRRDVKKAYFSKALWGWLYFLISLGLFVVFWRFSPLESLRPGDYGVLAGALIFSQLFALAHLQAVGIALLFVLKQTARLESGAGSS